MAYMKQPTATESVCHGKLQTKWGIRALQAPSSGMLRCESRSHTSESAQTSANTRSPLARPPKMPTTRSRTGPRRWLTPRGAMVAEKQKRRRAHTKSRRGCLACKGRHVKCDEQTPRCANCVVRATECIYPPRPSPSPSVLAGVRGGTADNAGSAAAQTEPSLQGQMALREDSFASSSSDAVETPAIQPMNLSVTAFSSTPGSSRILELELMHRWSTKTWASLYSVPDDQPFLQEHLPRAALFESYMMNGLFALAAADLAHSGQSDYLAIAYEYSTRATADYQVALQNVGRDNVHAIYAFAMIANIFNFSMPALAPTAFTRMRAAFDTVSSASDFIITHAHWRPPCSSLVLSGSLQHDMDLLSANTRAALDRLTSLSEQIRVPSPFAGSSSALAADVRVYQLAISHVKNSFAEDARGAVKGYCFCICDVVPSEYMAAVRAWEPMALIILMYFGVVVNQSSKEVMMWWIKSSGKELVEEVAAMLHEMPVAQMPDVQNAISWAREEVGLRDPMVPIVREAY